MATLRSSALLRRILFRLVALGAVWFASSLFAPAALAICVPTVYSVTSFAPPPLGNWTDTAGAVWVPSGGFPGCAPGDAAVDTNASPTTLIINSSIPNPLVSINLACAGCAIQLDAGGALTMSGPAAIGSGATQRLSGGTLTIANGGSLQMQAGSALQLNNGTLDTQTGGQTTLPDVPVTTANAGTILLVSGTLTIPATSSLQVQAGAQIAVGGSIDGGGTLVNAGLLQGGGTIGDDLTNDGLIEIGNGNVATLNGANFTWDGGGAINFQLGATNSTSDSDLLALTGALTKGIGSGFVFHFSDGNSPPAVGVTYTLITFRGSSGFVAGDFGYDYAGSANGLNGTFSLTANALTFTPSALPVRLQAFDVD